jgi:RHS repeat-associated protein
MASSSSSLSSDEMMEQGTATTNGPAPTAVYLYAGDQIIENVTTGNLYFQDSLGNTSHVTDAVGNLLERYTYSAFGIPTFFSANNTQLSTSAYGIRHLFQGQLWTQETGLNDYRNRVELPVMGVFLQPDPIGFKGDAANLYRFCNNNAVNRTDPMGLLTRDWPAAVRAIDQCELTSFFQAEADAQAKIVLALVPAGDRNQHAVERKTSKGQRMSGETVTDFKILEPKQQPDGTWKVTGLYIVDVYYMDAPGSKAGPKTMKWTYNHEWEHPQDLDTKFYAPALITVREMNAQLKFDSPQAAATALEKQLRWRFTTERENTKWRDDWRLSGHHNSPFEYEK